MTRVTWGLPTQRRYETGVDRGMLYPVAGNGVAWNGLISITESPTGGEAQPVFYDGRKVFNLTGAEDFEATISTFGTPDEFNPSDGFIALQTGLYVGQQPRKAFALSYRTLIGDAVVGTDLAYKIHLVYGCKAAPTSKTNKSISQSADPETLSWKVTTLPQAISGKKPAAHFVVNTRFATAGHVSSLEDILYGTNSTNPRMPTVSELVTLFAS